MEIAKQIAPIALAIIMFGLGLGLTTADFKRVVQMPKNFLLGFLVKLSCFNYCFYFDSNYFYARNSSWSNDYCSSPRRRYSNILTKFANGDVALSVTLTAIVSLISITTVPLIVYNSANFLGFEIIKEISMINIGTKMFFVVTVPVIFGMITRSLMTDFIVSKTVLIQRLSVILFLIVFISIWVEEWDKIVSFIVRAGLVAFILNITMIFIGYFMAKYFASGIPQRNVFHLSVVYKTELWLSL